MYRHARFSLLAVLVALALVAGCDDDSSNDSSKQAAEQKESAEQGHHHEGEGHAHGEGEHHEGEGHTHGEGEDDSAESGDEQAELVDVPADGTEYDPSVTAEQIPEGAWHCNMNGKVHYAATNEGDGECPVCGMDLVEKGSE